MMNVRYEFCYIFKMRPKTDNVKFGNPNERMEIDTLLKDDDGTNDLSYQGIVKSYYKYGTIARRGFSSLNATN